MNKPLTLKTCAHLHDIWLAANLDNSGELLIFFDKECCAISRKQVEELAGHLNAIVTRNKKPGEQL